MFGPIGIRIRGMIHRQLPARDNALWDMPDDPLLPEHFPALEGVFFAKASFLAGENPTSPYCCICGRRWPHPEGESND